MRPRLADDLRPRLFVITGRVQPREDEFAAAPISPAMSIKLRAVLDADNKPADWSIELWSPPHAQRPGMNGNSRSKGKR